MSNTWCIEYASGESSATAGKTFPKESDGTTTFAKWFQCDGAGTVVAVCEGGQVFTRHASGGEVYKGSFTSLTSTTCTYVVMGNGPPPPPRNAAVGTASATAQGSVALSVAPAVASNPIAVANSDKRVTTIEALVSFSGSDGTLTEQPFPHPAFACTLVGVTVEAPAAATASDTNYVTITFAKRDGAGGSATTLVAGTTQVTGGVNSGGGLLAFQHVSLGTPSATAILSTDVLTIKSAKTSAGVAIGPSIVRMTFTFP